MLISAVADSAPDADDAVAIAPATVLVDAAHGWY